MDSAYIDIKPFLEKIDNLASKITHITTDVGLAPNGDHLITKIKYQGLNQMRSEFIQSLVSSITRYVLSKTQYANRVKELTNDGIEESEAHANIFQEVANYFRKSDIKGQFSELLLYNFLQHYFKAIPVVRKMTITTNTEVERHGADAIHLGQSESGENYIYLGEAKTYPSGFPQAFKNGIKSILSSYKEHRNELQIYKYENVLPSVQNLIKKYLNGQIDLPVKLVVIISYCTGKAPTLSSKDEYREYFLNNVLNECKKIKIEHFVDANKEPINPGLLKELNYIIFPIDELELLLADFQRKLGIK